MSIHDVAILGGGPGGYVAAIRAAQLGLDTVIIEKDAQLGGTCLHRGCIPTKTWLHDSDFFHKVLHSERFAVTLEGTPRVDVAKLLARKREVVTRMAMGIDGLMKKNKIRVVTGKGEVISATEIKVGHETIKARHLVLATGSVPLVFPTVKIDGKKIMTSDELLDFDRIPKSMIIIGAGAVGMEFASIYHRFGTKVDILEALDRPLPLEDAEVSAEIAKSYGKQGITIHTKTRMDSVEATPTGVRVKAGDLTLEAEVLLLAAGRQPVTEPFKALNLKLQGRQVHVDEFCRTSVKGVYAIGDLIPGPQLAHAASAEGILVVEHIAGHEVRPLNPLRIPGATYCSPEVASVGLTEAAAKEKGYTVHVGRFPWAALGKAQIIGETEGFVKVVADEKYGELLGVHIVGPHATDLIAEAAVALECEATVEELYRTVHAHPTLSEALMEAGHGVFGSPIHFKKR